MFEVCLWACPSQKLEKDWRIIIPKQFKLFSSRPQHFSTAEFENMILVLLLLLYSTPPIAPATTPCLHVCTCEVESAPVKSTIRCNDRELLYTPLPVTYPQRYYEYLDLSCNHIVDLPDIELIQKAFPHLKGIDLQGNKRLNCSILEQFKGTKIALLSDCAKTEKTKCLLSNRKIVKVHDYEVRKKIQQINSMIMEQQTVGCKKDRENIWTAIKKEWADLF
ncbi:hypothetical protein CAEBREN_07910 [Caenorhabditis brenneri]|uniref:Uncharacterized protein n=1 Tax=Caenorhabditis brenneri TaxID=135651 RepID=G0MAF4_CAEBE|nr:hypothetical protein CAEBREN_07910 [Caenorhabditis brenneri]